MRFLLIIMSILVLGGCWAQDEMLRIQKNGDVSMAVIVMPDWEFTSKSEVDSKANQYEEEMRKAGWTLNKSFNGDEGDYIDLHYVISGNLHKVNAKTSFYEITKRDSKTVIIKFLTPTFDGEPVDRKIYFDYSVANTATVFGKDRSLVQEIDRVDRENIYTISL